MWELIGTSPLLLGMTVFLPHWPEPARTEDSPQEGISLHSAFLRMDGPGASETLTVHELLSQAQLRMTALNSRSLLK